MIQLTAVLAAWNTPDFESTLKASIETMTTEQLPLQQALSASSYALDDKIKAMILKSSETESIIRVKAGVFYNGIVAGCNCADDPTPVDEIPEYCDIQIEINKSTAATKIILLDE